MSTTSPKSSSALLKRLAYSLASISAAALVLLLPQTEHALPLGARPTRAARMLLRPAAQLLSGTQDFWHTEGNRILDRHNRVVRVNGVNWSGFETKEAVPGGLDKADYRTILRTIKHNGYNTVRIPFSNEMVETPSVPERVRFSNPNGPINTDLRDLTSLEILDRIVAYAGKIDLKIILDNHRSEAGSSAEESGLWYTPQFPESTWVEDWTTLARRYQNNSTVIGMDLRNEPHNADRGGACWDCGGENDWHRAAQRAGNAILAVNPHLLIYVEGVDSYAGDTYWWGGNLEGVRRSPVRLSVPNRLVYSAHEYGPSEYSQAWFNSTTTSASLAAVWRTHWAYISEAGIAPVWIGEFGTTNTDEDVQSSLPGSEGQWFTSLVQFFGSHPALGWTYWGINGEDRYGLLDASYSDKPANQLKAEALAGISIGSESRGIHPAVATTSFPPVTYPSVPTSFPQPALNPVITATTEREPAHPELTSFTMPALATRGNTLAAKPVKMRPRALVPEPTAEASVQSAISENVHKAVRTANQRLGGEPFADATY